MGPFIINVFLRITKRMQRYTIFFVTGNVLHVSGGSNKQARHTPDAVCTAFELLMMGEETA
jgi:hypothetical protein